MNAVPKKSAHASKLDELADRDLATVARAKRVSNQREIGTVAIARPHRDDDLPLPAPDITNTMYYGLVGEVMQEAAKDSEVNPAAAGLFFITCAGAALGRDRYVAIGNDFHHPRIYSVHVGRSNIAGKGMALRITKRIREACEYGADPRFPVCGNCHDGGLSSREGLAWAIRDASDQIGKNGNPIDAGVEDKRLLVVEEEFANVLAQSKRDGNTLSAALRTAWDGGDLAPLTKTNRTRATHPHVGIHACITPTELAECLATRELTNGFANRFLFAWAERQGEVAYPRTTPEHIIEGFAKRFRDAIQFTKFGGKVEATPAARDRFAVFYRDHRQSLGLPARVRGLLERHPPYAWRLALVFALLEGEDIIGKVHMDAALAWLDYCRASVIRIFSTATVQADAEEAGALVKRVIDEINRAGGQIGREPLRVALGKPPANLLNAAIEQAEMAGMIGITSTPRVGGGRPARGYFTKASARLGRFARFGSEPDPQQTAGGSQVERFVELAANDPIQARQTADPAPFGETLSESQTALTAQTADSGFGNHA